MARIASGGHRERQPRRQRAAELGARPIASQGWRPCWRQRTACAAVRGLTVPRDRRRGGPPNPRLRARAPCPVRPPPHRRRPALLESRGKTSRAAQASPGPRGAHENRSWDTDLRPAECQAPTSLPLPKKRSVRKPWLALGNSARHSLGAEWPLRSISHASRAVAAGLKFPRCPLSDPFARCLAPPTPCLTPEYVPCSTGTSPASSVLS